MTGRYAFCNVKLSKMLRFFSVAEAHDLIYLRPSGKSFSFACTPCLMMGEVSLETSPRNIINDSKHDKLRKQYEFVRISYNNSCTKFVKNSFTNSHMNSYTKKEIVHEFMREYYIVKERI